MFHRVVGSVAPPVALLFVAARARSAQAEAQSQQGSGVAGGSSPVATLYLIRHAESTWNAAFARKNQNWPEWLSYTLDPVPILTDKDHPLTSEGAAQCEALRRRIASAFAAGDEDALAMASPSTILTSSPLTRSIATAALTFPLAVGSRGPGDGGILLLPAARESDAHWFYGRDSIGTARSRLAARVDARLSGVAEESRIPRLDMSAMGDGEVWWSTGEEDDAAMAARLRALLGDVATAAAAKEAPAVVLTTHSLIIRRLFKAMLEDGSKGPGQLGEALGKQSIVNCGCVAVDLVKGPDGAVRMARPRMLFGTDFASFSPTI